MKRDSRHNKQVPVTSGREPLAFFDAHTVIGPQPGNHRATRWRVADLMADLEQASISAALVSSVMSVRYDPMFSNLELSRLLEPHPHLRAVWNLMPHQSGEFAPPKKLGPLLKQHGIRAVSLHPRANAWDLFSDSGRQLAGWLEEREILVKMPRSEFASYRELDEFLTLFPRLNLLFTSATWREQRFVWPLLQRHAHLHITLDHFQINNGIEDFAAQGLEDQIVFGSGAPAMSPGAHRAFIDYAEVEETVRARIASKNLLRLLREPGEIAVGTNENEDSLMQAARLGLPLPGPVLDMHMHILHEGLHGGGGTFRMSHGGPASTFSRLRKLGCTGGGFMSWNGTYGADCVGGNACVAGALDAAPPGFWGLATLDPVHYSRTELEGQMRAVYQDRRFIGMKPYIMFGVEYDAAVYEPWWRFGNENGFYAGIHRMRNDFREVDVLAGRHRNVRWVIYHCGSDFRTADGVIECLKKHPNTYAELTFTSVTSGIIEYLVEAVGAERILYGSDLPMRDPRPQLGWVVYSRIPVEAKRMILGGSAGRVIAPCLPRLPKYNRPCGAETNEYENKV